MSDVKAIHPVVIRGTGSYVPEEVIDNAFFEKYLDTSDDWIKQRTGIDTRHRSAAHESTATLATEAGRRAIKDAGLESADIDLVIVCTATPDYSIPMTAGLVQHALGIQNAPSFDISATCSGLLYGITVASSMMDRGAYKNALIIGSDTLTRFTDYNDRTTCILFGDGAGAVVLSQTTDPDRGIIYQKLGADGQHLKSFWVPAGGSREPASAGTVNERLHFMRMRGQELFKLAVTRMHKMVDEALRTTGVTSDELKLVIPHQSNKRIIESVRSRLKLPEDKVAVNIDKYGNTSSASIGLALDLARREGRISEGDLVLLVAFGAGVSWATIMLRL